jgi:hypothetical protein
MPLASEFYNGLNLINIFKTPIWVVSCFCRKLSISVVNFLLQTVTFLYTRLLSILVNLGKMKKNRIKNGSWGHSMNERMPL